MRIKSAILKNVSVAAFCLFIYILIRFQSRGLENSSENKVDIPFKFTHMKKRIPLQNTKNNYNSPNINKSRDTGDKTKLKTKLIKHKKIEDGRGLTVETIKHLKSLLKCNNRDFRKLTLQHCEHWVLKNYVQAEHGILECHESVTYTTHATVDFLDNVWPLVERWRAPVSIAVYAPGTDFIIATETIRYLRDCYVDDLVKKWVSFHILFPAKHLPPDQELLESQQSLSKPYNCSLQPPYSVNITRYSKKNFLLYPINVARNVARDAALTHFVLASDIELYPSPNLPSRFLNMISKRGNNIGVVNKNQTDPRVYVLPVFEVKENVSIPSSKTELIAMLANKEAVQFHANVCSYCHRIPRIDAWINQTETKDLDVFSVDKRIGNQWHWEPFFIGTQEDPYHDERFTKEARYNKMAQAYVMCAMNYDYMILNNVFLIHKPGIKIKETDKYKDAMFRLQMKQVISIIGPQFGKLFKMRRGCRL